MTEPVMTLIGVIIGGLIAPFGNIIVELWNYRRKRKVLAATISAELSALLHAVERRGHVGHYQRFVEAWKRGEMTDTNPGFYGMKDERLEESILSRAGQELGILGPENAADLVCLWRLYRGLRSNLKALAEHEVVTLNERIGMLEEDLKIWNEIELLGRNLIERLDRIS
jgi:uncharacterized protein YjiS (DUF1127 family)